MRIKTLFASLIACAAILMLGTPTVEAQHLDGFVVNVPFDFYVGQTLLDSGRYEVQRMGTASPAYSLRNTQGERIIIQPLPVQGDNAPEDSKLVFNQYGDAMFLSQLWTSGTTIGRELTKSGLEMEIAASQTRRAVEIARGR